MGFVQFLHHTNFFWISALYPYHFVYKDKFICSQMPWSPAPTPPASRGPLMRVMHDTDGVGHAARTSQQYHPLPNKISTEDAINIYRLLDSTQYNNVQPALERDLTVVEYFKFTMNKSEYDIAENMFGFRDPKFSNLKLLHFLENYKASGAQAYPNDSKQKTCTVCEDPSYDNAYQNKKNTRGLSNLSKTPSYRKNIDDEDNFMDFRRIKDQRNDESNLYFEESDDLYAHKPNSLAFRGTPY